MENNNNIPEFLYDMELPKDTRDPNRKRNPVKSDMTALKHALNHSITNRRAIVEQMKRLGPNYQRY